MLAVPLLAVIGLAFSVISITLLFYTHNKFKAQLAAQDTQLQSSQLLIDELQLRLSVQNENTDQEISQIKNTSLENEQVSKQLEHRIKVLQQQQQDLQDFVSSLQSQQPEDKLYSRASKLVELGADIEEIMRECDIPLAEAEMLLSIHSKKVR